MPDQALDYVRLSKTISRALRHAPEQLGLTLDAQGWVSVETLLMALRLRRGWEHLQEADLQLLSQVTNKKRFQILDGRIRAYYGHSLAERIEQPAQRPPALLYHGTSPEAATRIAQEGLLPMRRQYVHLSLDHETAERVARRHTRRPVILRVKAEAAYDTGIHFHLGHEDIWLADAIPPRFLER